MRKRGRSYGARSRTARSVRRKVPLPKKKRTTRSYARTNALAVRKCMRDVAYLKRASYGSVQKNLQVLTRPLQPTGVQPCFCVINDVQADNPVSGAPGAPWYQLNTGGASTVVSNFARNNDTFWDSQNQDIVDTGKYYLSALKLTFRVACIPENNVQISNRRVRIDIFKQRSSALKTPATFSDIQQLPSVNAQTRLSNMARPDLNKFNPEFFDLIMTKWVFLNPSKTDGTDKGTGAAIKYVSMDVPSKYLGLVTQQITDPSTPDDPSGPGFGVSQMPISKRLWCMVSSDIGNTVPSPQFPDIQITCQRYCSFRDSIGASAL